MRPAKPLTTGLLLVAIALLPSVARGRAVDRQDVITGLTEREIDCLLHVPCVEKRAFVPKFGEDGDGIGAAAHGTDGPSGGGTAAVGGVPGSTGGTGSGSIAQVGGTGGGSPARDPFADPDSGSSSSGSEQGDPFADPEGSSSGSESGSAAGPSSGNDQLPSPLFSDPFADLPAGALHPEGRVPGVNVLPREIPNHVGLEEGTDGQAAYQRFLNWDLQASRIPPPGSQYMFFAGQQARNVRAQFKADTNKGKTADEARLVDVTDIYPTTGLESRFQVPADREAWFLGAEQSLGTAQRAAQQGGTVIVVGSSKSTAKAGSDAELDVDGLVTGKVSFFSKYEAWMLSNGDGTSNVDQIVARNAGDLTQDPVVIWTRGQDPIGVKPEFVVGPVEEGTGDRPIELGSDDGIIDLGD